MFEEGWVRVPSPTAIILGTELGVTSGVKVRFTNGPTYPHKSFR